MADSPNELTSSESLPVVKEPTPPHEEDTQSLWSAVKESIRGSHRSYTTGPIGRSILLLAIPMVLEMLMESVFAVVDIYWVSHLEGGVATDAVATVGLTESMLTIVYALAIGLSIGAMAMVARRIGEGNPDGAARAAVQALVLALGVSLVIGAIGASLAPKLLELMGASPWAIEHGVSFTRVMLAGNVTVVMLFMINAIFRGAGDAAIAMRTLWLANWINILLGPCLIFGLGTVSETGNRRCRNRDKHRSRNRRPFRAHETVPRRWSLHYRTPAPQDRTGGHRATHQVIGNRYISSLHRHGELDRAGAHHFQFWQQRSRRLHGWYSGDLVCVVAVVGNGKRSGDDGGSGARGRRSRTSRTCRVEGRLLQHDLSRADGHFVHHLRAENHRALHRDPAVAGYGIDCLRIVSYGFLFYAYGMVLGQSFNGAGDTWTPTIINLFVFWLWEIPLGYALGVYLNLGPRGVFIAITIAFSTLAVVSALVFRRGHWKKRVV